MASSLEKATGARHLEPSRETKGCMLAAGKVVGGAGGEQGWGPFHHGTQLFPLCMKLPGVSTPECFR